MPSVCSLQKRSASPVSARRRRVAAQLDPSQAAAGGRSWSVFLAFVLAGGLLLAGPSLCPAQPSPDRRPVPDTELVAYVTVGGTLTEPAAARILNTALNLQHQAEQKNSTALLFIEVNPGTSRFGQVLDLAKELTSSRLSRVRTVAWIPRSAAEKPVNGYQAVLALACNEIVMHPDAELGDIGRGDALGPEEQHAILGLVEKRQNPKVSRALVLGMMDPAQVVLKVTLQRAEGGESEVRVLTAQELQRLRDTFQGNIDVETVWEAGEVGLLSGNRARALGVLVTETARSRGDLADLYGVPHEALRETPATEGAVRPMLIRIDGVIEPILQGFVERELRRAAARGINVVIFEIDSPGGFLETSMTLAFEIADLEKQDIRTVAYVPKMALSGAAILAFGCDQIFMRPDAQIGDAGPIEVRSGGQFERAPEKVLSVLRQTLRQLAERKGRPPALLEAMADKDLVVYQVTNAKTGKTWYMTEDELATAEDEWVKGPVVPESREENLLTVSGRRAYELGLAEPPVEDLSEVKQRLGISASVPLRPLQRTWVDTLVYLLNTRLAMFLLFALGLVFVYVELHMLTGFFGIMAALCFTLFFWARFLGGTAGWLEVVLFLFGLVLIALEIFVIPGFGVFGITGGLAVFAALILASQTFIIPHTAAQVEELTWTLGTLVAAVFSVVIVAGVLGKYMPRMPLLKQMILTPPGASAETDPDAPRLPPEVVSTVPVPGVPASPPVQVGDRGTTMTPLRPAGKARFGDHFVDVISEGPFVEANRTVEVLKVTGNRVVVREVD